MRPFSAQFFTLLSAAALFFVAAVGADARQPPAQDAPARALHELFEQEWEWALREFPTFASHLGDKRYNDRWPDLSLAAHERRHRHQREVLERIKGIDRARLSPADQLNYDLFRKDLEESVAAYKYRWHLVPLNQRGGIQTESELADVLSFTTVKDYEDWIARLRSFPAMMDQTIALMREGARARMIHPRVIMERIPAQIDKQITARPEDSPFYAPFKTFPDAIPEAERRRLASAGREAVASHVVPAYRKFREFFVSEYLPATLPEVGAWQMPDGAEMYAFEARRYTTTELTPRQIHETGLSEVKRIRAEMEAIMRQVAFRGTLQEFFQHLRTDPKFYYKTGDELLEAYRAMSKRIDPKLVKVLKTIPRMPYGVEPIPANIAPDTTAAYYQQGAPDGSRPGTYYVNLYKPEMRPKYEMMALSLHEAVPGHHFQIAIAQELTDLPLLRRLADFNAYTEGWGLYAERLADELGWFTERGTRLGMLTGSSLRAARVVIDIGVHLDLPRPDGSRWSLETACAFLRDRGRAEAYRVHPEIVRYLGWPAQATA